MLVSIVSIQTDQSRRKLAIEIMHRLMKFQSYQSKQINPDTGKTSLIKEFCARVSIVSIQTDQSRRK